MLLAVLSTVVLALLGSVVVLRQVMLASLDTRVEEGLTQEVAELRQLAGGLDPTTGDPFGGDAVAVIDVFLQRNVPGERETFVTQVDGELHRSTRPVDRLSETADFARWGQSTESSRGSVTLGARRVEYLAVPLLGPAGEPRASFAVLYDYEGERAEIEDAISRAELVSVAFLLLAGVIGWLAAGRALAPLRALTTRTRTVDGRHLRDRGLPEPRGTDEVATLTRSFNAMLARLDEASAAQRDFVADAGHELRTPITIVRGHLELLGDDPQEREEAVALVTDELDRMARLVEDLLTLAKADRADFLRPAPVLVPTLLQEVLAKAEVLGQRRWTFAGAPGIEVPADRQRLTQALTQLTANAVGHTDPGSAIDLGGAVADGALHLWVLDRGAGVAPADRQRIFHRFARGSGARHHEGAGLGLAIVAAIASAHGGRVELLSSSGTGSAFVLVLPLNGSA